MEHLYLVALLGNANIVLQQKHLLTIWVWLDSRLFRLFGPVEFLVSPFDSFDLSFGASRWAWFGCFDATPVFETVRVDGSTEKANNPLKLHEDVLDTVDPFSGFWWAMWWYEMLFPARKVVMKIVGGLLKTSELKCYLGWNATSGT